jgi:uncharacterized membrane protein
MATPMPPQSVPLMPANGPAPEPRKLPAGYGASWWGEGWRVFSAAPGTWIALVLILLVLMFLMLLVPIVGGLAQSLLMPVFGGGVMLGCHALARGEPLRIGHLFDGCGGSGRFGSLVIIGLVMLAASIVLGLICLAVIFATIGIAGLTALASLADPAQLNLNTLMSLGASFLLVMLIGVIGTSLIAMAYWFAPALVVLNGEEPLAAMRRSFRACARNIVPFLVYGLIYLGLAIVATIPLGLGWLVLAPMIAGSCYAGWRTVFS